MPEQHMTALALANSTRLTRSRIKKEVRAGWLDVVDVVESPPAELHTLPVFDLLQFQARWGEHRARKAIRAVPISERKTLGDLSVRQRLALLEELAPGWGEEAARAA